SGRRPHAQLGSLLGVVLVASDTHLAPGERAPGKDDYRDADQHQRHADEAERTEPLAEHEQRRKGAHERHEQGEWRHGGRRVAAAIAPASAKGPSRSSESASAGTGGTRLSHTIRPSMSTSSVCLRRILPTPQLIAEPSARKKPTAVRSWPTVKRISTSPANATATPESWRRVGVSRKATTAKRIVKSACVCTSSDARPGGNPAAMAKN